MHFTDGVAGFAQCLADEIGDLLFVFGNQDTPSCRTVSIGKFVTQYSLRDDRSFITARRRNLTRLSLASTFACHRRLIDVPSRIDPTPRTQTSS
jgi:hypothetical protein